MNLTSPKNWKTVKLGDIAYINMGQSPTSDTYNQNGEGLPFYQGVTEFGDKYLSLKSYTTNPIKIAEAGDIIFSVRAPVGRINITKNKCCIGRGNASFRSKEGDQDFLYFLLASLEKKIQSQSSGTVFDSINKEQLNSFEIQIPESLDDQREIAAILGSLDDKIELLRRENKTLESIAQALFREWFVEFRFPGYEGVKVDGVPEGWKVGKLTDIAEFLNGVASQKYPAENKNESLPVIKIREMRAGITSDTDRATSNIDPKYIIESGDLLFSWSGSLDVVLWNDVDGVLNQHLFKVSSENYPKWFYYHWTLQHLPEFKSIAESKATTMGHIQRHHLDDAEVLIPDGKVFEIMNDSMTPLLDKQILNNSEIRNLSRLRDDLLNKIFQTNI